MTNGHATTNFVVVTPSNNFLFPLITLLDEIKPFFQKKLVSLLLKMVPFFAKTIAVVGSDGWHSVNNGFQWEAQ